MKYPALLAALLALALSACGNKQEAAAPVTPAPEAAAPTAPAPAAPEAAAPAAPAPEAAMSPAAPASAMAPANSAMADTAAGATKFKTVCASCHGAQAQGQGVFPKLAGLTAADMKTKLETYRKGEKIGPMSATMIPMAKTLSDADIDNVTAYIASIK
jgi:cytochrome c553